MTYGYDRRGLLTNILNGSTSLTKIYNDPGNRDGTTVTLDREANLPAA
jgi:hypothetical protein